MMTVTTLTDGGQDPVTVAQALHDFLAAAQSSLDLALYDFHLEPGLEELVVDTLVAAGKRGVAVRIVYNADFRAPIPVPPPPKLTPEDIARLGLPTKPIAGIPDLMHHKYVVRDHSSVWTGSTNWTDDSWSREENVIAVVDSSELARAYSLDFEQLWDVGIVEEAGRGRAAAGSRGRDRDPAVVLPRLRRRALAPDREVRSAGRSAACGSAHR